MDFDPVAGVKGLAVEHEAGGCEFEVRHRSRLRLGDITGTREYRTEFFRDGCCRATAQIAYDRMARAVGVDTDDPVSGEIGVRRVAWLVHDGSNEEERTKTPAAISHLPASYLIRLSDRYAAVQTLNPRPHSAIAAPPEMPPQPARVAQSRRCADFNQAAVTQRRTVKHEAIGGEFEMGQSRGSLAGQAVKNDVRIDAEARA